MREKESGCRRSVAGKVVAAEIVEKANPEKGGGDRLEKKRRSEERKERITRDSRTRFSGAANCERESFLVVREEFSLRGRKERKK